MIFLINTSSSNKKERKKERRKQKIHHQTPLIIVIPNEGRRHTCTRIVHPQSGHRLHMHGTGNDSAI